MKLPNTGPGDYGGVHINPGIPNHAFYLVATALSGNAWGDAGKIWYEALCNRIRANSTFKDAANATVASAGALFGEGSRQRQAVKGAWREVGVLQSGHATRTRAKRRRRRHYDRLRPSLIPESPAGRRAAPRGARRRGGILYIAFGAPRGGPAPIRSNTA